MRKVCLLVIAFLLLSVSVSCATAAQEDVSSIVTAIPPLVEASSPLPSPLIRNTMDIPSYIDDMTDLLSVCSSPDDVTEKLGTPHRIFLTDSDAKTAVFEQWLYPLICDETYRYPYSDLRIDIDGLTSGQVSLLLVSTFDTSFVLQDLSFYYLENSDDVRCSWLNIPSGIKVKDARYEFYRNDDFTLPVLPSEQELSESDTQDVLKFLLGGGLSSCCIIDSAIMNALIRIQAQRISISHPIRTRHTFL